MHRIERYFDLALEAPDGIKRLRELILTLAMQGKLVEQDPNDPPAAELLQEIEKEKQRLLKQGKIKESELLRAAKSIDNMHPLPKGWTWVRLGEIVIKIGSGSTPRGGRNAYLSSGIPFLRSQNIYNDGLHLDDVAFISAETHKKMHGTKVVPMDILLNITGASLGRCALVPDSFCEANVSQHVTIIRPVNQNTRIYLHYLLQSPYCQKMIWTRQVGMAREGLSKKVLEQFEIPLPPLEEQKRIITKIEQLMARCDELERLRTEHEQKRIAVHTAAIHRLLSATESESFQASWTFLRQNFDQLYTVKENVTELRKAILQLAVMGKLVPQDPHDPPAAELLKEIEKEKQRLIKQGKINPPKPLPPIKPEEIPYELPPGWVWIKFGKLVNVKSSKRIFEKDYCEFGIPFYRSKEIGELSKNGKCEEKLFISKNKYNEICKVFGCPKAGDILLTSVGSIGGCWIVDDRKFYFKDGNVTQIETNSYVSNYYIVNFINSVLFLSQVRELVSGTAYNALTIIKINNLIFPLPPLAEQQRIVAKIEQLMARCDELERQIDAATAQRTALLNALLQ